MARRPPVSAAQVEGMAACGLSVAQIAVITRMLPAVLERRFGPELEGGAIKANLRVAEALYRKALGEGQQSITAAIFWLKARARWKETVVEEVVGMPRYVVHCPPVMSVEEWTREFASAPAIAGPALAAAASS